MISDFSFPLLVILVIGSLYILYRSSPSQRVIAASIGFGLLGALIFAACFILWGIGGIAFHAGAGWLALGLNIVNFAVGILVVRRILGPAKSPSQRDAPPPEAVPRV